MNTQYTIVTCGTGFGNAPVYFVYDNENSEIISDEMSREDALAVSEQLSGNAYNE